MPTATVDFTRLKKELDQLARRNALGRVMPAIAEVMVSAVQQKFEDEGPGWAPLSPATLARRRRSSSPKLLQDTGTFANSFTPAWEGRVAEAYSNVPYGKFHVTGTRKMPRRDPTDIDVEEVLEETRSIIYEALTGPG